MAAGAWVFTYHALTNILQAEYDFDDDTFKMALHLSSGTQPATSTTDWAALDDSEHAEGTGYTNGGIAVNLVVSGAAGTKTVDIDTD
ncbi:unnamed protein product, partial [marine sediment metagenome]